MVTLLQCALMLGAALVATFAASASVLQCALTLGAALVATNRVIEEIVDAVLCPTTGAFMYKMVTGYRVLMTAL